MENKIIKPCRVCKKVPSKGYPRNRIVKSDWICNPCTSLNTAKWRAEYYRKRKALINVKEDNPDIVAMLKEQMPLLPVVLNKPKCGFCNQKMRALRTSEDKGRPLYWNCASCNDIIKAEGL